MIGRGCPSQTLNQYERDLVELLVGRVLVRHADDQLLHVELVGRADHGEQRVVGRHDQRHDLLAALLRPLDDGRHQLLVVGVEIVIGLLDDGPSARAWPSSR